MYHRQKKKLFCKAKPDSVDVTLASGEDKAIEADKVVLRPASLIASKMRKTCTDKVYNMKKRLVEEVGDLQERINMFYSNKNDVLEEIAKEKVKILVKNFLR